MSNEHHQSGRRPNKAATERLNPENRSKQPLDQALANERHSEPNSAQHRDHVHHNVIDTLKQLDSDQQ